MKWVFKPAGAVPWPVRNQDAFFPVHNLYCVGRNYRDHVLEMGRELDSEPPLFFQKPPDVLLESGKSLHYPAGTSDLQHEVELVVALGKSGYNVEEADAKNIIFGYGVGIDLTRRDLQSKEKKRVFLGFGEKYFPGQQPFRKLPLKWIAQMLRIWKLS